MVDILSRIESVLERVVEGGSRALFRQRLQPIELAKAAARAMQRGRLVGPDGIEVPNVFVIALHPEDAAQHAAYRASLQARIAQYLQTFADDRNLVPVGDVTVSLVEDPTVRRWSVRIDARMLDAAVGPATRPAPALEPTAHLPRVQRSPLSQHAPAGAPALLLEDGRRLLLPSVPVTVGRALDNDIVVSDSRVSRYHARLERTPHGLLVRDLGSTNGTAVAGAPVEEGRAGFGDTVSLGGYRIEVQAADTGAQEARPRPG